MLQGAQDGANCGSPARDFSQRVKCTELCAPECVEGLRDPMLLGGSGTFDLVKRGSALNKGLRSPQKQVCCPVRVWAKHLCLIKQILLSWQEVGAHFCRECPFPCFGRAVSQRLQLCRISLCSRRESYALAVSQRSSVSTTTIPVQRIRILFLPNSFAARPFKPMKGATKCALARTEYSRASSPEKPGRERHSCLPCPKRSKFFCSDMSRWIPTVAGY